MPMHMPPQQQVYYQTGPAQPQPIDFTQPLPHGQPMRQPEADQSAAPVKVDTGIPVMPEQPQPEQPQPIEIQPAEQEAAEPEAADSPPDDS